MQKLARRVIFSNGEMFMKKHVREAGEKKVSKFTESAWKLTYYFAVETALLFFTRNEPWLGKTEYFWNGWPNHTIKYESLKRVESITNTTCRLILKIRGKPILKPKTQLHRR